MMCQTLRVFRKLHLLLLGALPILGMILLPALLENRAIAQDQPCSSWYKDNLELATVPAASIQTQRPIRSVTFSPNGLVIAIASANKRIEIWEVATIWSKKIKLKNPIRTFEPLPSEAVSVTFSPNGKQLASGSLNGLIKIWDLSTNQDPKTLNIHSKSVQTVLYSRDGQFLISGSLDKTVKVWNFNLEKTIQEWTEEFAVEKLALSPDGETLAVSITGGEVRLWNWRKGELIRSVGKYTTSVSDLAFSPNGKMLAFSPHSAPGSSQKNQICFWDLEGKQLKSCLQGHTDRVTSLAFSPDGHCLISGSYDDSVKVWRVASREMAYDSLENSSRILSVAFSPNGRSFVRGSGDGSFKILRYKQ